MEKHRKKIAVALRKEDGFIELIFGEDAYVFHPQTAMEIAKSIAVCLQEGQKATYKIPVVSFGGVDVELDDLIEEETIG